MLETQALVLFLIVAGHAHPLGMVPTWLAPTGTYPCISQRVDHPIRLARIQVIPFFARVAPSSKSVALPHQPQHLVTKAREYCLVAAARGDPGAWHPCV